MQTDRQDCVDIEFNRALISGFDIVQLKYDGWWCRLVVDQDGAFRMYSRTGRILRTGQGRPELHGVYIGEWMFGTNWSQHPDRKDKLFLFDCWQRGNTDLRAMGYKDRYLYLLDALKFCTEWMRLVQCSPVTDATKIWTDHVSTEVFEGVVWRKFAETVADKCYRTKRSVTDEYLITGVVEGEGKFSGMLGALVCKSSSNREARVGGGFTDEQRRQVWSDPTAFIGKLVEVQGKTRFEDSGLLRHPVFVRFKDSV